MYVDFQSFLELIFYYLFLFLFVLKESSEGEEIHEPEISNHHDNDSHVSDSESSSRYSMEAADAAIDSEQENSTSYLATTFPRSKRRIVSETSCASSSSNQDSEPEENLGPPCSRVLRKKKSARSSAPAANTKRIAPFRRVAFEQRAVSEQIPLRNERPVQNQRREAAGQMPVADERVPLRNERPVQNPRREVAGQMPVADERIPLRNERPVENQRGLATNALPVGVIHNQGKAIYIIFIKLIIALHM